MPGWLQRQLDKAEREVAAWPAEKRAEYVAWARLCDEQRQNTPRGANRCDIL